MSDVFKHLHRVSYSECTLGNHVYYARYLDILEEARGEFFRHAGEPLQKWQAQDFMFPVTEVQLKYKGAARYDDLIEIRVTPVQITRIRLQFRYEIYRENMLLLEATISHVCTGLDEKPKRMPVELCETLNGFLSPSAAP